jgi:hypothetical protein
MAKKDLYAPRPEDKFSFGLWTIGNRGRDPFGEAVRPTISPVDIVALLAEVGAWGVNLHDNDLVPIDATPSERDRIVRDFKKACKENGIVVPMATVSLFFHPIFRMARSLPMIPRSAPTRCKRRCAPWTWAQSWERRYSCCGAGEKEWRPTLAAALTTLSSDCAKP